MYLRLRAGGGVYSPPATCAEFLMSLLQGDGPRRRTFPVDPDARFSSLSQLCRLVAPAAFEAIDIQFNNITSAVSSSKVPISIAFSQKLLRQRPRGRGQLSVGGRQPISASSVRVVKDAFAELLCQANGAGAKSFASQAPHGLVVVKHLHGEACVRLRPLSSCAALTGPRRTRSSKIQNNVVSLHSASGVGHSLRFFAEVQPLKTKSSATIATSHHKVIRGILAAAFSADSPAPESTPSAPAVGPVALHKHTVHVRVGDSVCAHDLADIFLWAWMHRKFHGNVRLIHLVCATRATNLVAKTALLGADPAAARHGPTVTSCVRLFQIPYPE